MTKEGAIWQEFLLGDLTWDGAFHRLIAMGYQSEDAEDLVNEWADLADEPVTNGER